MKEEYKEKVEEKQKQKEGEASENRDKLSKEEREKKFDKQLKWVVIVTVFIIAGFIGVYLFHQSSKTFEYAGLKWDKMESRDLNLFHAAFPYYENTFNIYFRFDPRKNKIPLDFEFRNFKKNVIITNDAESAKCYDAVIATSLLGQFFGAGKRKVIGAYSDLNESARTGVPFANCSNSSNATVISLEKSDKAMITMDQKFNCYHILVGNCSNVEAAEKFILEVVVQSRSWGQNDIE